MTQCPYIRSTSEGTHWCALAASQPDHRAAMRLTLSQLEAAHIESVTKREFEDRVRGVIDALRAALGEE